MVTIPSTGHVKDLTLSPSGVKRIQWAARDMPVLRHLTEKFTETKPLANTKISGCLHITTETANLAIVLKAGGAEVSLCASNPLSTQDDVAAALVKEYGVPTFAIRGVDNETYYKHINATLDQKPHITMDDGADLVATIHTQREDLIDHIIGGTEETTTGVIRLKSMSNAGKLRYPIIAVNEALTKHLFDNRYGTGQSTIDGITRATNGLWAGKKVVVIGYGWCGRGVSMRARGLGAHVIITEVDPIRALEAVHDGFDVMPMMDASRIGDIFITVTGDTSVIDLHHMEVMKNGAIIANSGHFNVEINTVALEEMSEARTTIRPFVEEFKLKDGRRLYLLGEGRLINLAAAEGHPSAVMDMSFANQALSVKHLVDASSNLEPAVYPVPSELDQEVGRLKLDAMGIRIDTLTAEQQKYLTSWELGT